MPKITFINADGTPKTITAKPAQSIMQAATENNIEEIAAICGGSLACATCHIYIHENWAERVNAQDNEQSEEEIDMLEMAADIRKTSRLSCQVKITDALDGLVIGLPGTTEEGF